jgi:hypothetical protein
LGGGYNAGCSSNRRENMKHTSSALRTTLFSCFKHLFIFTY